MLLEIDREPAGPAEERDCTARGPVRTTAPMAASSLRLRHPMECLPYRPPIAPGWSPRRGTAQGFSETCDAATWTMPSVRAAADLGSIRVNFVYASFQSMTAARSEKAKRDQYFEGPNESHGFRLHEVDPQYVDVLYQPIEGAWEDAAGRRHRLTLDYGVETADGRVVFGEDKSTIDFFEEPTTKRRLDHLERRLMALGASLERRVAGGSADRARRRIVKDVFDARRTTFDRSDIDGVLDLLSARGGSAPLGRVLETFETHAGRACDMVFAMVVRRHLSIPLLTPVMPDTPVAFAPVATGRGALRAFLAAHVPADCGTVE